MEPAASRVQGSSVAEEVDCIGKTPRHPCKLRADVGAGWWMRILTVKFAFLPQVRAQDLGQRCQPFPCVITPSVVELETPVTLVTCCFGPPSPVGWSLRGPEGHLHSCAGPLAEEMGPSCAITFSHTVEPYG